MALDRFLIGAGLGLLALFAVPVMIPDYPRAVVPFLGVYGAASVVWLAAVWRVMRADHIGPRTLTLVVVFALLFRGVVLPQASILDDDLYRYVWDGRMTWHGVNPYRSAPNDDALSGYRDPLIYPHINFPYVPSIYPPLTQLVFASVVGLFGETLIAMKLAWTVFDVLLIAAAIALLRAVNLNPARVIVYAWAPLAVKEVAGSGHMDAFPVLLTLLAVLWAARRPVVSSIALGAAIAAKLYPILLVPVFLRQLRGRSLLIPTVVLIACAPFASVPANQMLQGLRIYGEYWMFNPGVFDLLQRTLSLITTHGVLTAKVLAAATVIAIALWRVGHGADSVRDLAASVVWILGCTLLLAPTADPWYLLWVLPFLCVHPNPGLLAWTGLAVLSYGYYHAGTDIAWLRLIEYAPVLILLGWSWLRSRWSRGAIPGQAVWTARTSP
ncbi:MAG: glycosyltransferase 87 family protein [Nitrospirota bacterium]